MSKIKIFSFVIFFLFSTIAGSAGRWGRTGDLNVGRCGSPTSLLSDGKLIIIGTQDSETSGYEVFDPATGKWTRTAMPSGVEDDDAHTNAILLPNGKVFYVTSWTFNKNWLYDESANTFTASAASNSFSKCGAWATLFRNEKVIIADDGRTPYIYDYTTDAIAVTGLPSNYHYNASEVLLPSDKVLIIGGGSFAWSGDSKNCEIYTYSSGTWATTGLMNISRTSATAVLLPPPWNNKVLVAGGVGGGVRLKTCELYDINAGAWSITDSMKIGKCAGGFALLPSGDVLATGEGTLVSELYSPATETWYSTDTTLIARGHGTLAILPTGKVLAIGSSAGGAPFTKQVEIYDPSNGLWQNKNSFNTAREAQTVTILPIIHTSNCSTNVLIAGGQNVGGALSLCELYNYCKDTVSNTASLNDARSNHTAVLLTSGNVLVAGGKNVSAISSAELYDVSTETWANTGSMATARFNHSATFLSDGRVLVAGGENSSVLNSCEVYNSGVWNSAGNMNVPRTKHTSVLLLDGTVLVIGGQTTGGNSSATCELWDGTNWTNKASLNTARYFHTATLLQSGQVLVIGGTTDGTSPLSTCEIYDPVANTWTLEGALNNARFLHNATILYSGLVLVTGGHNGVTPLSSCEIWDPAERIPGTNTNKWKNTVSLSTPRAYHSSVLVPAVQPYILTIGGNNGTYLNSIEQYDIGLGYRNEWQSTITNHQSVSTLSTNTHIEGTLFRGVSEADGGNYCHMASNDHPIMSFVRVGGGNFQGNGGGELLYMPISTSWNETHTDVTLPSNAAAGNYRIWSIVNGIPCRWCLGCQAGIEENTKPKINNTILKISKNPFTYSTNVSYFIPKTTKVSLTIYDISGRTIKTLVNSEQEQGNYNINVSAKHLKPGIYLIRLKTNSLISTQKLILIKT
ncbi:MAG: kelch repeat-containing protein [bacterium]